MGTVARMAFAATVLAGCFESNAVTCADGTVCPAGLQCAPGGCSDPLACVNIPDGTACGTAGACFGGACEPAVCGNGRVERNEQCDDGNRVGHDGCSNDCRLEQARWVQLVPASAPPARSDYALAYDIDGGRIVLFGGQVPTYPLTVLGDTWEWDTDTWTQLSPATSPGPRTGAAMAYDPLHRQIVLFGGLALNQIFGDTWIWNGSSWAVASPPGPVPAPRYAHAMAFDVVSRRVLLFGGTAANGPVADTWAWNGNDWTQLAPASSPSPRYDEMMTTDPEAHCVIVFGGRTNVFFADTWQWNGTTWVQLPAGAAPVGRYDGALAFHPLRGSVALVGGVSMIETLNDTWDLRQNAWQQINVGGPPARIGARLEFDALHGQALRFGGYGPNETWAYRYDYPGEVDESCIAGEDLDGDGLAGCDDPDCWGYCAPYCPPGATACDPAAPHCGDGACNCALEATSCPRDCAPGACP